MSNEMGKVVRLGTFILALAVGITGPIAAEVKQIELSDGEYILHVDEDDKAKTVRLSISYVGTEVISVGVGNAGIETDAIQQVKLCADCDPVIFLPVYDASSSYGAVTGVLAWVKRRSWWTFSILPLSRPYVEDKDGDGIFDLMDSWEVDGETKTQRYIFRKGILASAE